MEIENARFERLGNDNITPDMITAGWNLINEYDDIVDKINRMTKKQPSLKREGDEFVDLNSKRFKFSTKATDEI
jgi:hypothetical protein